MLVLFSYVSKYNGISIAPKMALLPGKIIADSSLISSGVFPLHFVMVLHKIGDMTVGKKMRLIGWCVSTPDVTELFRW